MYSHTQVFYTREIPMVVSPEASLHAHVRPIIRSEAFK